jgi:DHA2 family multidrug resistance protein
VLTSYIVAGAIVMPMTGWLADRVGSRRLFILSTIGFIVTSMLCGISVNLTEMVIFRILQGVCAAFIAPLSQSILLDINPPEKAPQAMALWGMGIMVAPILGPMIGGWLTESYNWRWVFYINLPIGIPTVALLLWLLPSRPITKRYFDGLGFAALALGVATLQLMLDRGQHEDWFESWEIRIEAIIAISALWVFFVHQMTTKKPMFDPELVTDRNFVTALAFMIMIGVMMFGIFALMPPMLQTLFGYSVFDTGLLLAPRGIGILIAMQIAARIMGKVDSRLTVGFGLVVTVISLWQMTGWGLMMDWHSVALTGLIQGLGMGFVFIPMNQLAFATLSMRHRTDGSSLLYLVRSIGGSLGISVMTTMLARNMQTSHEDLSSHITSSSMAAIDPSTVDRFQSLGDAVMLMLNGEVTRQAAMIAYLDNFQFMMILIIAFMPMVLLMRPPRVAPGEQVHPVGE